MTHTSSCFLPPFLTEKAPRHSATLRVGSPEPPRWPEEGGPRRQGAHHGRPRRAGLTWLPVLAPQPPRLGLRGLLLPVPVLLCGGQTPRP